MKRQTKTPTKPTRKPIKKQEENEELEDDELDESEDEADEENEDETDDDNDGELRVSWLEETRKQAKKNAKELSDLKRILLQKSDEKDEPRQRSKTKKIPLSRLIDQRIAKALEGKTEVQKLSLFKKKKR